MNDEIPQNGIIIYNTGEGESKISLFAWDDSVWLNQNQMAEFFATSKKNINHHVISILDGKELREFSVVKDYLTTAFSSDHLKQIPYRRIFTGQFAGFP